MMEKYSKNSLLGQLEKNGIVKNSNDGADYLPFGILTGNMEHSPFEGDKNSTDTIKQENKIIKTRLNELDNNLFASDTQINIEDKELTKSEKIKKIKGLIKKIDDKLFMLEDLDDKILVEKLKGEKEALNDALMLLCSKDFNTEETSCDDSASIKKGLSNVEKIIFKIFPVLKKNFMVRKALNKLVMLNESANNLCSKQIPYGESEGRYNDFIACLSCANVIHAKLTKKI